MKPKKAFEMISKAVLEKYKINGVSVSHAPRCVEDNMGNRYYKNETITIEIECVNKEAGMSYDELVDTMNSQAVPPSPPPQFPKGKRKA